MGEVRCYFHVTGGAEAILDELGIEVSSIDEARAEALKAIDELRRSDRSLAAKWIGCSLRIVGEDGRVLSTIPLWPAYSRAINFDISDCVCDANDAPDATETS